MAPEVAAALRDRKAVVALESTVIAHGLPRPTNLETARACESEVRSGGAVPATIAVADGTLRVGCDEALLKRLAREPGVRKASTRDLAPALARGELAATTVAATVEIAALAGITVLATGGIGGVHRDAERTGDVSADLLAVAAHPIVVVCAGAKSVLDVPRTLEQLETLGVPVVTFGADDFPAFTVRSSGVRSPYRSDAVEDAATIARLRLRQGGGMLLALPVAEAESLEPTSADAAVAEAIADAERRGIRGPELTPYLLKTIAARDERAIRSNAALLRANARFAAALARSLLEP